MKKRKNFEILDPKTTFIDKGAKIGQGTKIYPFTMILGKTAIGNNCKITASVLEDCTIGNNVSVGPYSHIRAGSVIEDNVEVGNFAEIVRSKIGKGTKAKHVSYLGDTVVGQKSNIGAGTISANYDGKNKWPTIIGQNSLIGVNTSFVAPVRVGKRVKTGAGAVVRSDLPDDATAIGVPARVIKIKGKRVAK